MLPGLSVPAPADAVSANSDRASAAVTQNFDARKEFLALARSRTPESHIAAVPLFRLDGARTGPSKSHLKG
jgi:hypothetical protein